MKLLQNPRVTGALAVAAMTLVCFQVCAPRRQPTRAAGDRTPPPVQSGKPLAPAVADSDVTHSGAHAELSPAARIDCDAASARFVTWVDSPSRDPFLLALPVPPPLAKTQAEKPSPVARWKLNAIWQQTGSRLAVINGRVYGEGDEILGYKVESILGDEVWIQGPERKERLDFRARLAASALISANTDENPSTQSK
jgi:hypothetical protein